MKIIDKLIEPNLFWYSISSNDITYYYRVYPFSNQTMLSYCSDTVAIKTMTINTILLLNENDIKQSIDRFHKLYLLK